MNSLQSLQLMGLLNSIKTGDPKIDAVLSVGLPLVLSSSIGMVWNKCSFESINASLPLLRWLRGNTFTQSIVYRGYELADGTTKHLDGDSQNKYLVRAIKLYTHQKCDLDLDDAEVELTDVANRKSESMYSLGYRPTKGPSTQSLLENCDIVKKPLPQKWHRVGLFDGAEVWMWKNDSLSADKSQGGGHGKEQQIRTVRVILRSKNKKSIDTFILNALEWYEEQLSKLATVKSYYFFDLSKFDDQGNLRYPVYQRYRLYGEKTFDTIFSQPSKQLVKMVDDFRHKRGKYGVPGVPYKLGILLHGPPGTGKTSLIKALAHYTDRHIVNVPLSRIKTNQDLRDMFFNREYLKLPAGGTTKLAYRDVLYVLEDVDAASKVVTRRTGAIVNANEERVSDDEETDSESQKNPKCSNRMMEDALSLAGILNVFDGIVATPGRMIVMTTNHPDLLDPALVRPGRIDKMIELSYMSAVDATAMLEHYFATKVSNSEQQELMRVFERGAIVTPATMERYILELETIQEVVDALARGKRRRCSE